MNTYRSSLLRRWRVYALAVLLVGALVGMRVTFLRHTLIIVDEFEHVHAAYLVSQGQTPYVDFFEHHPPLFYYLGASLLPMRSPTFETLIEARYLALVFGAATILMAWWLVRRVFGRTEALVTASLLLGNFFLFARGAFIYLDSYAAALVMLSAVCLVGSTHRPLRYFAASAALGLAVLFTQKAIVAAFAPAMILLARGVSEWEVPGGRSKWLRDVAAYLGGALVPAALLTALLGTRGLAEFFHDNVVLNMEWKARHFPTRELGVLALTDGAVYAVAIIGVVAELWNLLRRLPVVEDEDIPALFLASLGAGIFLLPVVWEEYFVMLVPFAVIVAGVTLTRWARQHLRTDTTRSLFRSWTALALLGAMLVNLIGRKIAPSNPMSSAAVVTVMGGWVLILGMIYATAPRDAYRRAVLWLAFLLMFPLTEQVDWIYHNSNADQRERLAYVLDNSDAHEPVFDGYSGYGVFRPHAYRYWFLHEEVQQMLSADEMATGIVHALEERKPPIAIVDQWVRTLPESVHEYIASHYADTVFADIKARKG